MAGCKGALANDVTTTALLAVLLNMESNNLNGDNKLKINQNIFLSVVLKGNEIELALQTDVVLVGDMYFSEILGDRISQLVLHYI